MIITIFIKIILLHINDNKKNLFRVVEGLVEHANI